MTYRIQSRLSGLGGAQEDELRRNALSMANELWAQSQTLAEAMSQITRAESFSSRALNEAIDLANRALRATGATTLQLTRVQFVSSVQSSVALLGAMSVGLKYLSGSPDIVRAWPIIGLVHTQGRALDQSTRAMVASARAGSAGTSGLGIIGLVPMIIAPLTPIILLSLAAYGIWEAGRTNAEDAHRRSIEFQQANCGPNRERCTPEQATAAYVGAYRAISGPSVAELMANIIDNAAAANADWADAFKKPLVYVAVIGGVAVTGALLYAAWPYLQGARSVGQRHATRLKRAAEAEEV